MCLLSSGSINNIHKVYKEKNGEVEALRGELQHFCVLHFKLRFYLLLQK